MSRLLSTVRASSCSVWLLGMAALAYSGYAHADVQHKSASFDCRKAVTEVEKLICADKELQELDASLSQKYKEKSSQDDVDSDKTVTEQRFWIKNIRNKCVTVDCLKIAYQGRIHALSGTAASFDCSKAVSRMENLICSDERLRFKDRNLGQAYRALMALTYEQGKVFSDQKNWLSTVGAQCNDVPCLDSAFATRAEELEKQRKEIIAAIGESISYKKRAFYSDAIRLPGDAHRTIAAFATQASAANDSVDGPQQDEDFVLDIYVLDTASRKVLSHVSNSISSDAIEFQGFSMDTTDYSKLLGVPSFGIGMSHYHYGCAGYGGSSLRLYAVQDKTVKNLLSDDVVTSSTSGMCQTDCESKMNQRELKFDRKSGGRFPDLIIREKIVEIQDDPKKGQGICKTIISRHEYRLPFDGVQYKLPEGVSY